jgi:Leucine-rich repeat (LRR) protein/serine/threonine protein kinase
MTNTGNLKQLLREHVATAYPLAEAYQSSYTDTLEAIYAAVSPGWKDWLVARRKQEFMAQVVHYYLVDFAQVKGWPPEGVEATAFKNLAATQYQALLQDSKSLFQTAALPPFTEAELAGIVIVKELPSVTQLVLERLRSFQIRLPEAEVLAFLQHQELLGKGIEFFLRHHPEIAAHLQELQTTGLWDTVQNVEKELATLKQAGIREQIHVEDEFKAYDNQTLRRVGQAVGLLRKGAVKPAVACQAWLMAGSAVFSLGEIVQARQLLEEALQLAQNDAEAAVVHFNLFQVYLREDTTTYNEVAFYHLQTAMTLDAQYRFYDARKYQLQRFLGAGGMGCAFVGQELVFQREVVIKWFWQKFTTAQEVQQVFQEASLMWRIPREYVPAPLDVSLHGDSACLITEYLPEAIDGESWLKRHGPLSVKEAMSVALQLARGLQAAHQQGVWHLDLKPANVLLYHERSELLAKIIDFGLSRLAQPLLSQVRRSQKQSSQLGFRLAGTWDYAAPEQRGIKKYGPLSAKSDVYGLGKTLMRLCTGKFPQDCRERDMPVELREVVFDCIEENPALRPDGSAVIAQLQGVTQQREEEARQQQLREQREREEAERQRQVEEEARQQQLREQQEREAAERQRLAEEAALQQQLREQQEREAAERQRLAEEAARQQQLQEQQKREAAERQRQAEESQNHILWVDDRPSNNLSARETFEKIGVRVTLALSTNQALKILEETKFTAVISDMARPEGPWEGYTLLDTMRKKAYQTPLFFYTGLSAPEHQRRTLAHGGQGCTDNSQELFEMVTKVLNKDTRPQQVNHPPIIQQLQKSLGQELPQLAAVNVDYKGYQLNANQQVVGLSLYDMGLTDMPQEVWQLTQLQVLGLGDNHLTQLPKEIGRLTQLRKLQLGKNQLTQLPAEIWQLTQLRELRLATNHLTQLPPEMGQLTQLRKLSLDNNQLTLLPSEIGQLTQLRELGLTDNQLTQLPPEIGQLTQMRVLWLKGNRLTQLPEEIGQLTQLEWLWLEDNPLPVLPPKVVQQGTRAVIEYLQKTGQVKSAEAGTRPRLESESKIIQRLQKFLGQELPQLEEVSLTSKGYQLNTNQQVVGLGLYQMGLTEVPREVWQLTQLQVLWLMNNYLTQLPPEIGQLKQLRILGLGANHLTQLPAEIGQLTQLQKLGLWSNYLTQLPAEIGQLTQLQELWLMDNQLTQLPPEIGQLTQLQELYLDNNPLQIPPPEVIKQGTRAVIEYFQGKGQVKSAEADTRPRLESESKIIQRLQKFLGQELPQLEEVSLTSKGYQLNANQQVVGLGLYQMGLTEVPREVWQLTQLQVLRLMNNYLTQLPPEIGQLTQLQKLGLGNNQLTQLPPEIGQLTQLQKLGLLFNQLTQLPPEIGQLTQLQELWLMDNQLTQLPPEIGQLTQLQELYLDNNPLQIPPPEVIKQGTQAVIEYLQKTGQAKGAEPDDQKDTRPRPVGDLTIIQQLQESLGQKLLPLGAKEDSKGYQLNANQQVVGLSLYDMGLTEMPREVWQLTQLQQLWLVANHLTQLPSEIGQLTQLQELDLEGNHLTQLPPAIGQLMQLQKLDLGNNQLIQLPPEIGQLMRLQFLRLTGNHLTQLPKEIGLLRQLQFLGLRGNQLTHLPSEMGQLRQLQMLKLENNQLTQLPPEMGQLTQLQELYLDNNPLQVPPPEVIQQGTQAVIEYFQEKCQAEIAQKQEDARQQQLREQQEREEAERKRLEEAARQLQLREQQEHEEAERQRQAEIAQQREEEARQLQLREQQEREEAERQRLAVEEARQLQLREQQEREEAERQRRVAESARRPQLQEQQASDLTIIQRLQESLRQKLPQFEEIKLASKGYQLNAKQQVVGLSLYYMGLKEIPREVWQLTQLQVLGLRSNRLTQLPKEIGQLTQLRELDLKGNQLTQLPFEIGQLTQLRELGLSNNPLQVPPRQVITQGTPAVMKYFQKKGQAREARPRLVSDLTITQQLQQSLGQELPQLKAVEVDSKGYQLNANQQVVGPAEIVQQREEEARQQQLREQQEREEAERQRQAKIAQQREEAARRLQLQEQQASDLTIIQRLQESLKQELPQLNEIKLDSKGYQLNAKQQVVSLALCQMNLTEIPKTVWQLTQLQFLGLRGNQLTQLPKEIGQLTQLQKLQLEKNQLAQLPPEIGQLKELRELQLTTNQLTQLPPKIRQLTQLQKLGLWGNQLTQLPKEIGLLRQLQILDVGNNQLARLPKEIGLLTQLQKLGVGNNQLTELPSEIGLLTQLQTLEVGNNKLTQLPSEIGQLTQLQKLYLDNNPLQVPPPKVIQQGTQAVIKYFQKKWWRW